MKYEYQSDAGDWLEVEFPMRDAPPIGHVLVKDGVKFTRRPSVPSTRIAPKTTIISYTTDPNDPDAPHQVDMGDGMKLTAFDSKREIDEWCAKRNHKQQGGGKYVYDPHVF